MSSTRYVLPGLYELAVKAVAFVVILVAAAFFLGAHCGRTRGLADGEQLRKELSVSAQRSAEAFQEVQNERAETDAELDRLREAMQSDTVAKASARRAALRADSLAANVHVVEQVPIPATPSVRSDTTAIVGVARIIGVDTAFYPVPKFVTDAFASVVAAKDSLQNYAWLLETRVDQATRLAEERIAKERAASDTLDARRGTQVAVADSALAANKPARCGAKCGALLTLGGIVAAKIAWDAIESLVGGRR